MVSMIQQNIILAIFLKEQSAAHQEVANDARKGAFLQSKAVV